MKKQKIYLAFLLTIFLCNNLLAQNQLDSHLFYHEKKEDPYLPMPTKDLKTTSPVSFKSLNVTTVQVNTDSLGNNILNDAANEPSIAVDPNDPSRIAIGWRQFENIQSNFRQAGIAISEDTGKTWVNLEPIEHEIFRSDPVLDTDSEGNFYYNSLDESFTCSVFKTDQLNDWTDKTYAFGGDKQWMVIDKTSQNSNGHIYAFWKAEFSACTSGNLTRSVDDGESFENCEPVPTNPTRGTMAIDLEGNLYAAGMVQEGFRVMKSTSAKIPDNPVGWEGNTLVDLKGTMALYDGPNPGGLLGQVWVATDPSFTENEGNVYLLATVTRTAETPAENDPADIMFSRSVDGTENWSEAIQINTDSSSSNWQWFGTMSVAPMGRIDVVWLDTRDNPGTMLSSLYYSFSLDGGLTWSENERISESFDPHIGWPNQQKMGDYFHMVSFDNGAHLAWAATFSGGQDVFYSFIPYETEEEPEPEPEPTSAFNFEWNPKQLSIQAIPNPILEKTRLVFNNPQNGEIKINLLSIEGRLIQQIHEGAYSQGLHSIEWTPLNKNLNGLYFIEIMDEFGRLEVVKVVLEGF